jgi:DNA-binding PadR family transcriptional regulator
MQKTSEQATTNARQIVLSAFAEMNRSRLDLHTLFEAAGNDPAERQSVLDAVEQLQREGIIASVGGDFYALTEEGTEVVQQRQPLAPARWGRAWFVLLLVVLAFLFLLFSARILRSRIQQGAPPAPGAPTTEPSVPH